MIKNKLTSNILVSTSLFILAIFVLLSLLLPFEAKGVVLEEEESEDLQQEIVEREVEAVEESEDEEVTETTTTEERAPESVPENTLEERVGEDAAEEKSEDREIVETTTTEERTPERALEERVGEDAAEGEITTQKDPRNLPGIQNRIQTRMEEHRERSEEVTHLSVRERVTEMHQNILEKQEERRVALQDEAKERVMAGIERMKNQLNKVLESLERISDKIEARIETLEEMGADVEESLDLLAEAKLSLEDSRTYIEAISEDLLNITEGETSAQEIRALVNTARESLNETRKSFIEVVRSLKKARPEVETSE